MGACRLQCSNAPVCFMQLLSGEYPGYAGEREYPGYAGEGEYPGYVGKMNAGKHYQGYEGMNIGYEM